MFGITFRHGTLRKYVIYFGTLFNNIYLNRYDANGTLAQNMKVPLNYGPREKFLSRAEGNQNLDRQIAIQLPRMAFELSGMEYDPTRAINKTNKFVIKNGSNPNAVDYQYSPVPYDIHFTLSIMVKNAEDGTFIVEQILPYFTPEWTATLNLNVGINNKFDVPLILNDVSQQDTYEGDYLNRRALIWTLQFTLKGWFFGPTRSNGKIIREIDLNFKIPPNNITISDAFTANIFDDENIVITPGMDGSNNALNWYGSIDANIRPNSVSSNNIFIDSNYGFMIDFTSE